MTRAADEFIRRFLLQVLPEGFQRIRYYGFLTIWPAPLLSSRDE
jgi:Putative transposase